MRVRRLEPADLDACLDLFAAVCAERRWLATEPPVDRREVRRGWEALLGTGEGTLLLAEAGAGAPPAGMAMLVGRTLPQLGMLVAAGWRGQGVGDALVRAAVGWAREAGARELVLHVFPHNTAARALYAKHGFAQTAVLRRAFPRSTGERWDAIRMTKPLGPA
jgi:RimJ/RimL family protein N-acetyltransferase